LAYVELEGSVEGKIVAYLKKAAILAIDDIDLRKYIQPGQH
jgi:hypothetical protein